MTRDSVTIENVRAAASALEGAVKSTPFQKSETLSQMLGCEIWLKFENQQFTASFKERGALNKLLQLTDAQKVQGVIAMSAGNHAQGVAYHAHRLGIPAVIVMPEGTPTVKVEGTRSHGAKVMLEGGTLEDAARFARDHGEAHQLTFIHPYDDPLIVAGQGTVALEMLAEGVSLDALVVPIGGGGLMAGMGTVARAQAPDMQVIGVQSALYPAMHALFNGRKVPEDAGGDSLAEGIAVKRPGALTAEIIKSVVDDIVLVTEPQLERAVTLLLDIEKTVAEGAGAAGLAAVLADRERFEGKRLGLVVCGGNIDMRLLSDVLTRELARAGRIARLAIDVRDRPGELASLTRILADQDANILDISHHRVFTSTPAKGARTLFEIETRDRQHLDDAVNALSAHGYTVSLRGPDEI
ncbi:MAG: threonine ammonia-lyase [Pseudomonadota bacterium]